MNEINLSASKVKNTAKNGFHLLAHGTWIWCFELKIHLDINKFLVRAHHKSQ